MRGGVVTLEVSNGSEHFQKWRPPPSKPDLAAIAVVDSNALFTENDVEVVNAEFAGQLAQFKKFDVEFVVPQVVVREILFRKLAFLRRLENDVRRNLSTAARLTDSSLHPVPSFFILSLRLARRWKKWASTNGIRVSAIPFEQINWKKLCSASVHRRPPFSPFEPVSKSEKGFRDALILETLKEELRRADKKVIFVCNDDRLKQAAEKCRSGRELTIYSSLAEYLSYLQLENENFLTSVVAYIIDEGQKAFYSPDNPNCIYTQFNIPHRIQTEFPKQLAQKPPLSPLDFLPLGRPAKTYSDATNDAFQLGTTTIRKYVSTTNTVLFTSSLRVGRVIRSSELSEHEQLRIAEFKVDWRASWDAEKCAIKPIDVENIHAGDVNFELATDELLKAFNLPTFLERIIASLPKSAGPSSISPTGD
jgi:rRNA-processing protein FCF1